ncbi:uncharacterized protein LOC122667985 isoform X3 [Telopea speciosissima]|uniref:uncharacterized protein LOC122667985 isoform X3 n=1 Tax=Telopea speciosissima TaxID=54955 RepID=UPI001CC67FDB|nr:uncharacterized protein LOC122667985 isoform X3 [Telopea speciosissima]
MGRRAWSTSLLFQSKSFCFSLLYLFTTLFLALYSTISTKCIFRSSSPFNPIQKSLFSYPPTYGEHKYAIPTVRSSCTSPVFFSDYSMVLKDIKEICQNSSSSTSTLNYPPKKAESFAGNFSTKERMSYFDHRDDQVEVPCGFMKQFPFSDSENVDMAISKHPYYIHTIEEAMATVRWKKWGNVDSLKEQMEVYCQNGLKPWTSHKLPYTTDVPDTALILRRHGVRSNLFSCLMFNELEAFNPRDQLAFAYVRDKMNPKIKLNMFEVEVFEQIVWEFRHNLIKHGGGRSPADQLPMPRTKWKDVFINNGSRSCNCSSYLLPNVAGIP